ncbi:hypothetical protein F5X99DRAFT_363146 [Biscogniauxia marginata]|nr:hypothetical protein F5X99DRAFT_363146 [Biscogniauxia marginata]
MARPESGDSTIEIAEVEKSFPTPPRSSPRISKNLPSLPPAIETRNSGEGAVARDSPKSPATTFRTFSPIPGMGPDNVIPPPFGRPMTPTRPTRPMPNDPPRPMTASTKRLSFSSSAAERGIKYGTGKDAGIELSPRPSDDPQDPLNWPLWRKHLNFTALLFMVALVGAMKTAYISVDSFIAIEEGVSYTAAVALTGVPLIISAVTGMASTIIARIWGKRPVYLVSTILIFIGVVWNTKVNGRISENMAARVFQGMGWGAFDTLVLGSIQETYFEHQRQSKILVFYVVSVATTWGSPLLGGIASSGPTGFVVQFEIISCFMTIAIPLIVFGVPETTFDRSSLNLAMPTLSRTQSFWPGRTITKKSALDYLGKMKPWSYKAKTIYPALIMQMPRAMVAPSTLLLFVATLIPHAGLWGLASSISLLFSPMPFVLPEAVLGALMVGPFILATVAALASAFPCFQRRFTPTVHLTTLAMGTVLASVGLLGFGLYLEGLLRMPADGSRNPTSMLWDLRFVGERISFPVVSFLLGLIAAGSVALDDTMAPVIQRSTAFTSANLAVGLRNMADMHAGLTCLRNLAAGAFVLGIPNAVWAWDGLRATALGMGVIQIFLGAALCAVWWYWDENIRRFDGRVMGLVDLSDLSDLKDLKQTSFFERR